MLLPEPLPGQSPPQAPTQAPTPAPTQAPTLAPTERFTATSTPAPTPYPTSASTPAPTSAPTAEPTPASSSGTSLCCLASEKSGDKCGTCWSSSWASPTTWCGLSEANCLHCSGVWCSGIDVEPTAAAPSAGETSSCAHFCDLEDLRKMNQWCSKYNGNEQKCTKSYLHTANSKGRTLPCKWVGGASKCKADQSKKQSCPGLTEMCAAA